ncbi:helix-turn-helix domain-containing protein [Lihuaxuella thermophila]|uniref:Helix-turn-helix n=1 Tax=Lihuaxuella thermophila TaxID=1173111 RepID=A0A1H8FPX5_9BACL|nr:helix-turn-helix transcriptional regulator [Lihuaxuella thermophila]SEN33746.1 Helix-turn-helix [Lihuaxuella thermophila]
MDKPIDRVTIGHMIRKKRKELRLRLEDVADENVSPSTISNIERGVQIVAKEKIAYVAQKLEVEIPEVSSMLRQIGKREQKILSKLKRLMSTTDFADPAKALKRIDDLKVDEF